MALIAINVLLEPDQASVERAQALNSRLLAAFPAGFALDANHTPHITLLQRFVRLAELEALAGALREGVAQELPLSWQSTATGTHFLSDGDLGALGIVIQPSDDWRRLQRRVIEVVEPFAAEHGTAEAFAPRLDGGPISQPTVDYVNAFVGSRTGSNYNPHITVGLAQRTLLETIAAEPFEPFPVQALSVGLYQVGDYGVAQRKLHDLHRC